MRHACRPLSIGPARLPGQPAQPRRRRFVACLALYLATGLASVSAAPPAALVDGIREHLVSAPVLRGEFEQTKHVAGFRKPLVSHGDFLIARERGVLWRTQAPFASELRLTRDEISASQEGQVTFRLNAATEPTVRTINGVMFALLNGEISALAQRFEVSGELHGANWHIVLVPRDSGLARLMRRIELAGDQYVRRIEFTETNEDETVIRLSGHASEPAQLTAAEVARFE